MAQHGFSVVVSGADGCSQLTFDPKTRITVEQALQHPYLANYRSSSFLAPFSHELTRSFADDPDDEPVAPPLDPSFFDFDLKKDTITRDELKKLLYDEIMAFQSLA